MLYDKPNLIFALLSFLMYTQQQKETQTCTVTFPKFREGNSSIFTDLKCVDRTVHHMNFTHLDSLHFLKERGRGHFKCQRLIS